MSKTLKHRLFIIIAVAAVLVFYARTVPQISLSERAVVVGIGLDYDGNIYSLSAQIIKPVKEGEANSSDDSYGIVVAEGKTIAEAVGNIQRKTGLTVALSQCNVMILGNSVLESNVFPGINYLVQTYQIPEQSVLLATDGKAVELLKKKPVLTPISAYQIQQTLTTMEDNSSVVKTDVRDFLAGYLSESGVAPVAYVTAKEVSEDDSGDAAAQPQSKLYEFDYQKCVLFSANKKALSLSEKDAVSINYVFAKITEGNASIEVDGSSYLLTLKTKKYKDKVEIEKGRFVCTGKLEITFVLAEADNLDDYFAIREIPDEIVEKIADSMKKQIESEIRSTHEKCRREGYDVFRLYDKAFSQKGDVWKKSVDKENYLNFIEYRINADIKVIKK